MNKAFVSSFCQTVKEFCESNQKTDRILIQIEIKDITPYHSTIKIILSDIPLYDKENVNDSIFSCDFANVGIFTYHCLMKKEDFLSFYKDRVKVLYYNCSKIYKNSN